MSTRDELTKILAELDDLPFLIWSLYHSADLISEGERKHGAYAVPWGTLSWSRDTAQRVGERLEQIAGEVCHQCRGQGCVDNPEARYDMDNDTGMWGTNDPEEIECPRCDGKGLEPPPPPEPKTKIEGTFCVEIDNDLPF